MEFLKVLEGIRSPFMDKLMMGITYLGSEAAMYLLVAIILWCVDKRKGYRIGTVCFSSMSLCILLKGLFMIPRPWVRDSSLTTVDGAAGTAQDFSFPSGHSTIASSSYGSLAHSFGNRIFRVCMFLLPLVIAFSRMYLGVHTPQDIGIGLLIGYGISFLFYAFVEKIEARFPSLTAVNIGITVFTLLIVIVLVLRMNHTALDETQTACMKACLNDACTLLGVSLGLTLGRLFDERYIRFDTHGSLPAQLLKVVLGLGLMLGLRSGLKALFALIAPESLVLQVLRYLLLTLFLVCIWPLSFPSICRLCRKN